MFCIKCCYVVCIGWSNGLVINVIYYVVCGKDVRNVGLGGIIMNIWLYFDVVVF